MRRKNEDGFYVTSIDIGNGDKVFEGAARSENVDLLREAADLLADKGYVSARDPNRETSLRLRSIKIRKDWDDILGWRMVVTVKSYDPIADISRENPRDSSSCVDSWWARRCS